VLSALVAFPLLIWILNGVSNRGAEREAIT
jgi:hypothetical protein